MLRQPEKRFSLPMAMAIMEPIMEAVTYLHSQRSLVDLSPVIHQDIKPANIIISKDFSRKRTDKVVLVGFGIGKKYNPNSTNGVIHHSQTSYEAPEQYSGEITTSSDIYGLGATFYNLLTGIVPTDPLSRASKSRDPLKSVNQLVPGVSTLVAECIERAMSLSCNDRFPTVNEFYLALRADPAWQKSRKLHLSRELDQALKGDSSRQLSLEYSPALSIEEQLHPSERAAVTSEDQQVLEYSPALSIEEQLLTSEEAAVTSEDQQVLDVVSSTLIGQQLLVTYDEPSDTFQQASVLDVTPLIPIDQQVSEPDVDVSTPSQPQADTIEKESAASLPMATPLEDKTLPEAEEGLAGTPDQLPAETIVAISDTLDQPLPETENGLASISDQLLPESVVAISDTLDQRPFESIIASITLDDQQLSVGATNGIEMPRPGSLSPSKTSHYNPIPRRSRVDIEMSFSQSGCEWFVKTQEQQNNNWRDTT